MDAPIVHLFLACDPQFSRIIKEMQDHFGGEHLWCEYPGKSAHGLSTCHRAQWKIGPPDTRPQCSIYQRQKQINTCAICFRVRLCVWYCFKLYLMKIVNVAIFMFGGIFLYH